MKNFNVEFCDKAKDIMIIDIGDERYLVNPSTFDGVQYYNCKKIDNNDDNKPYIIKEIRWGGIIGYEVFTQSYPYKEQIYDFSEMYDEKRDQYILRLNNNYFVFDDDCLAEDGSIHAHQIGKDVSYDLRSKVVNGEVVWYSVEGIYL